MARSSKGPDRTPGVFSSMVQDFLEYIVATRNQSPATQRSYKLAFRLLARYMHDVRGVSFERITFSMMTVEEVEGFARWLSEPPRGSSGRTVNARLAAIRSFARYAANHNLEAASRFQHDMSKVENRRCADAEWSYFTTGEVAALFDLPKHNTAAGRRDATLLPFMFATAARCQEVCDLKVRDVEFLANGRARITITGKGGKRRLVTIGEDPAFSLRRYIRWRGIADVPDAYVFNTQRSPQMSVDCIEDIYDKYVGLARREHPDLFPFDSYSPHSMRHATGVSMVEAGVPLPVIRVFFGHSSVATTEIYAKITQPTLEQKILEWNRSFWGTVVEEAAVAGDAESQPHPEEDVIPDFLR